MLLLSTSKNLCSFQAGEILRVCFTLFTVILQYFHVSFVHNCEMSILISVSLCQSHLIFPSFSPNALVPTCRGAPEAAGAGTARGRAAAGVAPVAPGTAAGRAAGSPKARAPEAPEWPRPVVKAGPPRGPGATGCHRVPGCHGSPKTE